jgi:hypothetical protein
VKVLITLIAVVGTFVALFFSYNEVMERDEIFSFRALSVPENHAELIQLSGTLKSGVLVVKSVTTKLENHVMLIRVNATFAWDAVRRGTSSSFAVKVDVPPGVDRVVCGRHRDFLWERKRE